ncbi:MAG: neutral/alkaline non-lysosomal ceramidase N-terminal domain-containing protein [Deltaproteobacteria bacterium]|nr:neutral/alkaline non-lysosomal ceramidase N-terminal domain-containing protein [Deltaproteobacteria bacterium]
MRAPWALVAVWLLGCSPCAAPWSARCLFTARDVAVVPPRVPTPGLVYAGVARADVTPPPGPSQFGHGPDAVVAAGYWTRLYCRAFVFETAGGERTAVVPCDLAAVSMLLHRAVAARLRAELPAQRLFLTATHTHAAPAHYLETDAYGGFLSSRAPGFDQRMLDFLAERIARAVHDAGEAASRDRDGGRPARLSWTRAEDVYGVARNRSLPAWRLDPEERPQAPAGLSDEERAVDPTLEVLRVDRDVAGARVPIGVLAFFAVHPTVLPHDNALFGGDLFGVASRRVERWLRQRRARLGAGTGAGATEDPLAGIVNTNEGDLTAAALAHTEGECLRLGERLGDRVLDLAAQGPPDAPTAPEVLASAYAELPLPGAAVERWPGREGPLPSLCEAPLFGLNAVWGASDHPTSLRGFELDVLTGGCHGPKRRPSALPVMGLPETAPLGVLRLGSRWIALVPAELTLTAGRRLLGELSRLAGLPEGDRPVLAGLANGYLQYVATREEYALQRYEGASTLYGPGTLEVLTAALGSLARALGPPTDGGLSVTVRGPDGPERWAALGRVSPQAELLGPARDRLGPTEPGRAAAVAARGSFRVCRLRSRGDGVWCVRWRDGAPGAVQLAPGVGAGRPWLRFLGVAGDATIALPATPSDTITDTPSAVEPGWDPGGLLDDRGLGFHTWVASPEGDDGAWDWVAVFRAGPEEAAALRAGPVRLRVGDDLGAPGAALTSPAWDLAAAPPCEDEPACTARLPD